MNLYKKVIFIIFSVIIVIGFSGKPSAAANTFTDIPKNPEAYHAISTLSGENIIKGYDDGTFRPYNRLTRAQGATIIGRTLDVPKNLPKSHRFKDVNAQVGGHEYINTLTGKGIFSNVDYFNPYNTLTRAQMAKILVIAFDLKGTSNKNFKDVPKNHWASEYIQTLVATGITTGTSSSSFSPSNPITRIQMAIFIDRTLNYIGNSELDHFKEAADDIFKLTNKERTRHGLKPLKRNQGVEKLAMLKAKDLYINDYFDHTSPVHGTPFEMMANAGIRYRTAGENIAFGYRTAEAVMEGWMNSPGHKANILNPKFTHIGIGYYEFTGHTNSKQYVQMFITPY